MVYYLRQNLDKLLISHDYFKTPYINIRDKLIKFTGPGITNF